MANIICFKLIFANGFYTIFIKTFIIKNKINYFLIKIISGNDKFFNYFFK